MQALRLGWQNPRPNDFTTPDERPLRDMFTNLQQFLTIPHFGITISGNYDTTFADKTLAAITGFNASHDSYSLVRNNTVQVPRDFDTWLFVGVAAVFLANTGTAGRHIMGWRVNAATLNPWVGEVHTASTVASIRVVSPMIRPLKKGDTLSVAVAGPAGGGVISEGQAFGFFLPLA